MRLTFQLAPIALLLLPAPVPAQIPVTDIQIQTDPAEARVRPLESLVIQVRAYGEVGSGDQTEKVRLQRNGARFELKDPNAGWLSKPFRYQGSEDEPFYQERGQGLGAIILGRATEDFVLKDSVVFTASERTGRYRVEVSLERQTESLEIEVSNNAPVRRPRETVEFPPNSPSRDPYRRLAEHYAPLVAQETWFEPKSDYLARFDLDGDWRGDNNWENADVGSSQAYVYYAAMETDTHWFLIYNFFHPRDYSDKCIAGTCHENDNEGMILTIAKDGSAFGRLQTMETLAHNNIYSYWKDSRVRNGIHSFDGDVELYENSRPVIFIESGGHGVYGSDDDHSRFSVSSQEFSEGTGVTYIYKGKAERPRHPNDRNVGYDLLPIYEHWWLRAHEGSGKGRTFDDYYVYEPYGRRPRPKYPEIAGSFLGREYGSNKAKPFWGWHDRRTRKRDVLATGQWGLDPAYGAFQNLRFRGRFSLRYTYNPYLGIGEPRNLDTITEAVPARTAPPPPASTPSSPPERAGVGQNPWQTGASNLTIFQPPRSKEYDPDAKEGQFDVRMHVDGEIEVFIQGSAIRYRVLSGRPPTDDGSEYSQPIPRATFSRFELDKKDGRGEITLIEPPSAQNNYTVKFRINDPKGGPDRYHARLRWEWEQKVTAAPEPGVRTPSLPADPRASQQEQAPEQAASGSRVLSRHIEALRRGPIDQQPGDSASAPLPSDVPGVEIYSEDNDPAQYNNRDEGLFEFRGRIDGTVRFRIRGDRVLAENISGRPVEVERFSFTQPVPSSRVSDMGVEKKDGRGKVVLLERPWEGNHFLAVVEVSDPKGGEDRYHFRLTWKQ